MGRKGYYQESFDEGKTWEMRDKEKFEQALYRRSIFGTDAKAILRALERGETIRRDLPDGYPVLFRKTP